MPVARYNAETLLDTDGLQGVVVVSLSGVVPGFRYGTDISGWHVPALSIDHYSTSGRNLRDIALSTLLYTLSLLPLKVRDDDACLVLFYPLTH